MAHPLRGVLVVVALLLLLNLDHGLPQRYVPDDTAVRCALGMARDLTSGEVPLLEALAPPDGRYTSYPMLLPWLDLAALGGRFGLGLVRAEWSGPGSFKAALFEDPGLAWLPARWVSVLLGMLLPLSLYRAARCLGRGRSAAALAALMAGSSLLFVQYAHTTRPWAAMLGLAGLTLWMCLRLLRRRRLRDVLAAFAAGALCGSSFQVGLAFAALPVGALLVALCTPGQVPKGVLLGRGALGLCLSALLLCGLGYPHLLLHGSEAAGQGGQAALELAASGVALGGQSFSTSAFSAVRAADVTRSWLGSDPVLALAGLAGLLLLGFGAGPRRTLAAGAQPLTPPDEQRTRAAGARPTRLAVWVLVLLPGFGLLLVFTFYEGSHVRYLMSATPFLALGAGELLARMARAGGAARGLALLLLSLPLLQAARLDQLLGREDTRSVAARALPAVLGAERRIALDGMGSRYAPPLLPRAESLLEVAAAGVWLGRLEREIVSNSRQGLASSPEARQLLPIQRFWRYDSYYASDYLYDGLSVEQQRAAGREHDAAGRPIVEVQLGDWLDDWRADSFVQVDRVPDDERRAPLTALLGRRGRLLWELSPTGRSAPRAAELPTDMGFPLTDLWTYQRPGPWIRVWDLTEENR
ncbi:MAG: hypothetical protein DRQ55_04165 [Planctomycetota bacterium]|nr:MAG: hypothetical protein DRQ55_04165 [Planctomycetota bacterium]